MSWAIVQRGGVLACPRCRRLLPEGERAWFGEATPCAWCEGCAHEAGFPGVTEAPTPPVPDPTPALAPTIVDPMRTSLFGEDLWGTLPSADVRLALERARRKVTQ